MRVEKMRNDRHNHHQERQQLAVEAGPAEAPHAQDHWRVNLAEDWEIGFWSREFGCSEHDLRRAVHEVGVNAGCVRAFLASQHQQQRS